VLRRCQVGGYAGEREDDWAFKLSRKKNETVHENRGKENMSHKRVIKVEVHVFGHGSFWRGSHP